MVVAVSVVVLWPVVDVAVLWHVVVAVVPSMESVLKSLMRAAAVQFDLVVLVVVHVLFSSQGLLLSCPQERDQEHEGMIQDPIVPASMNCAIQDCFSYPATSASSMSRSSIVRLPTMRGFLAWFSTCSMCQYASAGTGSTKIPRPSA